MPNRPRPDNLHRFKGDRVPRNMRLPSSADAKPETAKQPKTPPPPKYLEAEARLLWRRIVREMIEAGHWKGLYTPTLGVYVSLLADFHENPGGFGASKLVQLRLLQGDLGLSPSHAHRVSKQ